MFFFSEVHLLASKLVPVVTIHPLRGSHGNRHHMPNPQSGAAQPTQDGNHTSHAQSTRVAFGAPPGKAQEPLINHREVAKNNHRLLPQLLRYSRSLRHQQTPRVTRKPQQIDPQVPLDAITQANALRITQSHFNLHYQARR
jgi:hypothetical protein